MVIGYREGGSAILLYLRSALYVHGHLAAALIIDLTSLATTSAALFHESNIMTEAGFMKERVV